MLHNIIAFDDLFRRLRLLFFWLLFVNRTRFIIICNWRRLRGNKIGLEAERKNTRILGMRTNQKLARLSIT